MIEAMEKNQQLFQQRKNSNAINQDSINAFFSNKFMNDIIFNNNSNKDYKNKNNYLIIKPL